MSPMPRFRHSLASFMRDERGAVAVETALSSIVLVILITGGFEGARAVLLEQKLDRVSSTVSDLVARREALTGSDLNDIYSAAKTIMKPFDLDGSGVVYVSVVKPGSPRPGFVWQRKLGGTNTAASKIGTPGSSGTGAATLPSGFTLGATENVVVAEVFYAYTPIMGTTMFTSKLLYQASFNRPRLAEYPALQ